MSGCSDTALLVLVLDDPRDKPIRALDALQNGEITGAEAREMATALSKLAEIQDLQKLKDKLLELETLLRSGEKKG
jgi:hypothetical protein